jgi:competence protein ComEA
VFDAPPSTGDGGGEAGGSGAPAAKPNGSEAGASAATTRLAVAGVVGAFVIGVVAVVVALSGSGSQLVDGPARAISTADDHAQLAGSGELVVEVTGAVAKPGVYHLPAGSRVGDAIDAAGGFSPRVDADRVAAELNLAQPIKDGAQLHVPSRDEPATATGGPSRVDGAGGGTKTNLNTATQSALEALPGIGPVTAAKIIESRATTPFATIDDLRERKLVGEKAFDQLKSLVTVD